jgi:hypothetical protein
MFGCCIQINNIGYLAINLKMQKTGQFDKKMPVSSYAIIRNVLLKQHRSIILPAGKTFLFQAA